MPLTQFDPILAEYSYAESYVIFDETNLSRIDFSIGNRHGEMESRQSERNQEGLDSLSEYHQGACR